MGKGKASPLIVTNHWGRLMTPSTASMAKSSNLRLVSDAVAWPKNGCAECMAGHSHWVHLNMCRVCGHVGCCDSSPNKHATKHFQETGHPVIQRFEPGEDWGWDYKLLKMLEPFPVELASSERHPSWESGYKPVAPEGPPPQWLVDKLEDLRLQVQREDGLPDGGTTFRPSAGA